MCLENRRTNIRCRLPKIMLTFLCSFEDKWFRPFENERLIKIAFDQHNQIYSGSKKVKSVFALVVFDGCEERNSIWTKRRILLFLDLCVFEDERLLNHRRIFTTRSFWSTFISKCPIFAKQNSTMRNPILNIHLVLTNICLRCSNGATTINVRFYQLKCDWSFFFRDEKESWERKTNIQRVQWIIKRLYYICTKWF